MICLFKEKLEQELSLIDHLPQEIFKTYPPQVGITVTAVSDMPKILYVIEG